MVLSIPSINGSGSFIFARLPWFYYSTYSTSPYISTSASLFFVFGLYIGLYIGFFPILFLLNFKLFLNCNELFFTFRSSRSSCSSKLFLSAGLFVFGLKEHHFYIANLTKNSINWGLLISLVAVLPSLLTLLFNFYKTSVFLLFS